MPDGLGTNFKGVVSVLDPPEKTPFGCPIDPRRSHAARRRHRRMRRSDDGDVPHRGEPLRPGDGRSRRQAVEAGTVIPIFCTAGKKEIGVEELLHALAKYSSTPVARARSGSASICTGTTATSTISMGPTRTASSSAWSSRRQRQVRRQPELHPRAFRQARRGPSAVQHAHWQDGPRLATADDPGQDEPARAEAYPGDIIAVAKVEDLHIGDTVAFSKDAPKLPIPEFPKPMFGLAVEPKNRGDEQKISQSLHKIADEDPTFKITHDPQTHELVINGVSQLHLEVIQHRLKKRFDLEVVTKEPKIPYRETIASEGGPTIATRSRRAAVASSAKSTCASIRYRARSRRSRSAEEQFANKSKFEKMRVVPLRSGLQLRLHRPHRRRHDPE